MTLRSHCALAALSVLATATLAITSADARPGQGRGQRPQPSAPVAETVAPTVTTEPATVELPEAVTVDSPDSPVVDGSVVEASGAERQSLPPGLQRQVDSDRGLPPGLQRQVDSDRGLPPGLQRSR